MKRINKIICPVCRANLLWGGDNDYDDYGIDGEGIVSNYTCVNKECEAEDVIIYKKLI